MSRKIRQAMGMLLVGTTLVTGVPVKASQQDYTGHWAENQLKEWVAEGVLSGYEDGSLRPNGIVTRAEFAKMLVEVFGLTHVADSTDYTDVVAEAWYTSYVERVVSAGFMQADDTTFRPNAPITREEAAYAVATAYHIQADGEVAFTDAEAMGNWAKEAVNALALQGYLQGYEDGTFRPQGELTRAEAVTMLDKVTADIINVAGTYNQDVDGNVVVNTTDVILKDMTIKGNLYLAEGIGEGDVTLDNVVVTGQTIVEGGGENSIELVDTKLEDIVVNKASGRVRLAADKSSTMGSVQVQSAVQLEGEIEKVEVNTPQEVKLVDAKVEEVNIVKEDAKIVLDKDTVLETLVADAKVEVSGEGEIEKAEINADEVKIEGVELDEDNVSVDDAVTQPPIVDVPNTGGDSSDNGSSGEDTSNPVDPVEKTTILGRVKLEDEAAAGAEVVLYKMVGEHTSSIVAKTTTDEKGLYSFKEVEEGDYRLEIKYTKDGAIYETSVSAFPVGTDLVVQDVVMEKKESTELAFTVTAEEGAVADAKVYAEAHVPGVTNWGDAGTTDANGQVILSSSYTFPIGTEVTVTVEKEGYVAYTGTYTTTAEGMNDVKIILEVEETLPPVIVGEASVSPSHLVTKEGEEHEFTITLPEGATFKQGEADFLATSSEGVNVSTTMPEIVDEKTMTLTATMHDVSEEANFQFYIPQELVVGATDYIITETITLELEAEPVAKGAIEGSVYLGEEVAAGAEVVLFKMTGEHTSSPVVDTTTDANGHYSFTEVEAGDYRLEITYTKDGAVYETSVSAFPVGEETVIQDVVIEKKASTAFFLTVESEEGAVADARVQAEAHVPGVTNWGDGGTTDANGQITLSSKHTFPVGTEVTLTVEKEGYMPYTGTYTTTAEGMNDVNITLEVEETLPPVIVGEASVSPSHLVTKEGEEHEFTITLPEGATFEQGEADFLATSSEGVNVSTTMPEIIDDKTMTLTATMHDVSKEANFKFYIPQSLVVGATEDIVTEIITLELDEEQVVIGEASVSPSHLVTTEGERHEFTITLPEGATFKQGEADYLSTSSNGVRVSTSMPEIIDEKTMTLTATMKEVSEEASFNFYIPQGLVVEATEDIATGTITVELKVEPVATGAIEGTVSLGDEVAAGAEVLLYKMTGESTSSRVAETTTDADGQYSFTEVEAGNYRLQIKYTQDGAIYETSVSSFPVGEETVVQDVVIEKKESTALYFTVESAEGPVADASVKAEAHVPGVTTWGRNGRTDANGQVTLSSKHTFPVGTVVTITVEKEGYTAYSGTYTTTAEGMNDVSITLEKQIIE